MADRIAPVVDLPAALRELRESCLIASAWATQASRALLAGAAPERVRLLMERVTEAAERALADARAIDDAVGEVAAGMDAGERC